MSFLEVETVEVGDPDVAGGVVGATEPGAAVRLRHLAARAPLRQAVAAVDPERDRAVVTPAGQATPRGYLGDVATAQVDQLLVRAARLERAEPVRDAVDGAARAAADV